MAKKFEDLTGKSFGLWIVLEFAGRNEKKKILWLSKCSCIKNTIRNVLGDDLRSGKSSSCGCVPSKKASDLTGMKFGRLTIINRIKNKGNCVTWLCKCECGESKEIKSKDLKSGNVNSCGCIRKTNEFIIYNDFILGVTKDGDTYKFDLNEFEKVTQHSWYKNDEGYFQAMIGGKQERLQRYIMNAKESETVDHRNHDLSNNLKSNLRKCNNAESVRNRGLFKNNTSGVTGVIWNERKQVWISRITVNYKRIHLGCFKDFEEAVKVRKEAQDKFFGEFNYDKSISKKSEVL